MELSVRTFVHMHSTTDAGLVCYVFKDFKIDFNCIYVTNSMIGVVNPLPILKLLSVDVFGAYHDADRRGP